MMKEPPFRLYDKVVDGIKTEEYQAVKDVVNNPSHYTQGGIECIDAIRAALTDEEFRGYCKGNILKYVWRERHKGGTQDIQKAKTYANFLMNKGEK
jgi:hypothetical protein